jgi:hypothetical protein
MILLAGGGSNAYKLGKGGEGGKEGGIEKKRRREKVICQEWVSEFQTF